MPAFHAPVWQYVGPVVHHVREDAPLAEVNTRLSNLAISALLVRDKAGKPIGTISRTDLLSLARERAIATKSPLLLQIPDGTARDAMTEGVVSVDAGATLGEAARRMAGAHIHRVFVEDKDDIVGVVTTREVLEEVAKHRIKTPICELMHDAVVIIRVNEPLSLAVERMEHAGIHGVVVVDERWPVGIFDQACALEARYAANDEAVEHWMSLGFQCLPMDLPVHRAAAQALAGGARRILAMDAQTVHGILSELDIARAASLDQAS
jgi:predicted transcriptional regulator